MLKITTNLTEKHPAGLLEPLSEYNLIKRLRAQFESPIMITQDKNVFSFSSFSFCFLLGQFLMCDSLRNSRNSSKNVHQAISNFLLQQVAHV